VDAGTGILNVDLDAYKSIKSINILLTHLHMDHIQGLGFFKLLFNPNKEVNIWGPKSSTNSLYTRLSRFISPPLFPVPLRDFPCQLHVHELEDTPLQIGPFEIISQYICHPGPTVGYRIRASGKTVSYIPDHEPVIGKQELFEDPDWLSGYDLAYRSDLLIHDAQYEVADYFDKVGWGHSSMKHAADFAEKTSSRKLLMFHHDPGHDDAHRIKAYESFLAQHQYAFDIALAFQGSEYIV
jgi:ribonuclease BN (tRNA processing enzyme)